VEYRFQFAAVDFSTVDREEETVAGELNRSGVLKVELGPRGLERIHGIQEGGKPCGSLLSFRGGLVGIDLW